MNFCPVAKRMFRAKGGTTNQHVLQQPSKAFRRHRPCLSPVENRENSYAHINSSLDRIRGNIKEPEKGFGTLGLKGEKKIIVSSGIATVKIEPNYTFRKRTPSNDKRCLQRSGRQIFLCINKTAGRRRTLCRKICAALDRQHPRDLFDIERDFCVRTGITDRLFERFIYRTQQTYVHELLDCNILGKSAFCR